MIDLSEDGEIAGAEPTGILLSMRALQTMTRPTNRETLRGRDFKVVWSKDLGVDSRPM